MAFRELEDRADVDLREWAPWKPDDRPGGYFVRTDSGHTVQRLGVGGEAGWFAFDRDGVALGPYADASGAMKQVYRVD